MFLSVLGGRLGHVPLSADFGTESHCQVLIF